MNQFKEADIEQSLEQELLLSSTTDPEELKDPRKIKSILKTVYTINEKRNYITRTATHHLANTAESKEDISNLLLLPEESKFTDIKLMLIQKFSHGLMMTDSNNIHFNPPPVRFSDLIEMNKNSKKLAKAHMSTEHEPYHIYNNIGYQAHMLIAPLDVPLYP